MSHCQTPMTFYLYQLNAMFRKTQVCYNTICCFIQLNQFEYKFLVVYILWYSETSFSPEISCYCFSCLLCSKQAQSQWVWRTGMDKVWERREWLGKLRKWLLFANGIWSRRGVAPLAWKKTLCPPLVIHPPNQSKGQKQSFCEWVRSKTKSKNKKGPP